MSTLEGTKILVALLTFAFLHNVMALSHSQTEQFLKQYMPLRDNLDLSEDFIYNNIRQALQTRERREWAKEIPEDIFLDYVLPYSRQGDSTAKLVYV